MGQDSNGQTAKCVHVLVAEAFIGPRPYKTDINHIDGNKRNSHVFNLEYISRGENIEHANRMGMIGGRLTINEVIRIRALYRSGASIASIARMFKSSDTRIRDVAKSKYYRWVRQFTITPTEKKR